MNIDLTNCDREQIHIIGKIQSYAHLIALDIETRKIVFCSENCTELFDSEANTILGKKADFLISKINVHQNHILFIEQINLILSEGLKDEFGSMMILIKDSPYYAVFSMSANFLVIEFIPAISSVPQKNRINKVVNSLLTEENFQNLLNDVAKEMKNLIAFHHIMIYQFLEDGSGKVIAEEKEDFLSSYMHHHFPESDIPKQARALYVINKTRLIADVDSTDSPILSINSEILDMTHCKTRAVSPMHIEYLKNMGVKSSFSVSIVVKGKLWGLIACHHYEPRRLDFELRQIAELLGEIVSSVIKVKSEEVNAHLEASFIKVQREFQSKLLMEKSFHSFLENKGKSLLKAVNSTGVTLFFEEKYYAFGEVPPQEFAEKLLNWFLENHEEDLFESNHLSSIFPEAEDIGTCCSGVLIMVLSRETKDAILWFKKEKKTTIQWAGEHSKSIEKRIDNGEIIHEIHPRKSFETYVQKVHHQSEKWLPEEKKSAERIKQIILETTLQKSKELKNLNDKLQEAYKELDTFAYTISHDLKTPLTVMKMNAQLLHRTTEDDAAKKKIEKIVENTDSMSGMIDEVLNLTKLKYGEAIFQNVEMQQLLEDVINESKIAHHAEHVNVVVKNVENLYGDQMMIYQLFANILGNAIKYSVKGEKPEVVIESSKNEAFTIYKIQDNGIGIEEKDIPKIFDLFKRFGNAVSDFKGTGVGMAIVKRIIEKHNAEIDVQSKTNEGTTIILKFPNKI